MRTVMHLYETKVRWLLCRGDTMPSAELSTRAHARRALIRWRNSTSRPTGEGQSCVRSATSVQLLTLKKVKLAIFSLRIRFGDWVITRTISSVCRTDDDDDRFSCCSAVILILHANRFLAYHMFRRKIRKQKQITKKLKQKYFYYALNRLLEIQKECF